MRIKFLGTHNAASKYTKLLSFVVDGILAVDAGSLTSLTFDEQNSIKAILLSHGHYDHLVDIPNFAFNNPDRVTDVFATRQSLDILSSHLMDGTIYPEFGSDTSFLGKTVLRLVPVEPSRSQVTLGYKVTASLVRHSLSGSVGFEISTPDGKSLFYTGDTGPGLSSIWKEISPQLVITDTTFPNKLKETAEVTGHLCPETLKNELMQFNLIRGYMPRVAVVHMFPQYEEEIEKEVEEIGRELDISISITHECEEIIL